MMVLLCNCAELWCSCDVVVVALVLLRCDGVLVCGGANVVEV